ncbi:hypothetical protein KC220_28425, partial [Mycobacterium tuberculosis]|nr:hypothetical protein [Mycobacterium tuberculosis]
MLFGCASLPGADPAPHREALALLHGNALAPDPWRVVPLLHLRIFFQVPVPEEFLRVLAGLPPLIKAYL